MQQKSRKKRYRRKKLKRILLTLTVLIILLVILIRNEIKDTINNSDIAQNINSQLEDVFGENVMKADAGEDRWNYTSKYEYSVPQARDSVEIVEKLRDLSDRYPEFTEIYDNMYNYPESLLGALCNNPDMIDFVKGYPGADITVTEGLSREELSEEVPLLIQWDTRWGYVPFGDDNIALSGCAPTCLTMVIVSLTGNSDITPATVAEYAEENEYYIEGTGTQWKIMTDGCLDFGIKGEVISLNREKVFGELEKGYPIICSMSEGDFTAAGHFIVLAGVKDGKIIVNDPNSKVRSSKLWDYETLESQIKNLWVFNAI